MFRFFKAVLPALWLLTACCCDAYTLNNYHQIATSHNGIRNTRAFSYHNRMHVLRTGGLVASTRAKHAQAGGFGASSSTTSLHLITDDVSIQETALHRFRRRKTKILQRRKARLTGYLFALWYALSVGYNLFSKKVLNMAPELAWTTAWLQMTGGLAYVLPLWWANIRPTPSLSVKDTIRLFPVAFLHSLVHIGGVVSMGAGAVSFTYIVKASEPAVSAALAASTGSFLPTSVYLTLIPVIAGVGMVSVSELSFSWKSFNYAMLSNLASSSRAIVGKKRIDQRLGQNMTPMNLYAVLTIMSSALILPLALLMEGSSMIPGTKQLIASKQLLSFFGLNFLASLFYYGYNEVAFLCLDNVSPVSHAIANVIKRVFIIVSSMMVFGNKMTLQGYAGSVLAVGGVLVYSLEKSKYKKRKEREALGKASRK